MTDADFFARAFAANPLMVILRGYSVAATRELAGRAVDAGIGMIEVPVQSEAAAEAIAALVAEFGDVAVIGAGTVTSSERLERARAAGARFAVAPGFDPAVARASTAAGLPHLPGVATATEVQTALAAGYSWLKAFPAAQLTPSWFTAMAGPFPEANFVATGGLSGDNAPTFFDHGARAVSFGEAFQRLAPEVLRAWRAPSTPYKE